MLPATGYRIVAETHYTVIAWSWHAWSIWTSRFITEAIPAVKYESETNPVIIQPAG